MIGFHFDLQETDSQEGFPVYDEDVVRLSAYGYGQINMLGRYSFSMPDEVKRGELLPLRTTDKS